MSLIKSGICEECGDEFYWSIGHPSWWKKITWTLHTESNPEAEWWFDMGNVCAFCAPPFEPSKETT